MHVQINTCSNIGSLTEALVYLKINFAEKSGNIFSLIQGQHQAHFFIVYIRVYVLCFH